MRERQIELHDVGLEPKDVPEAREPRADVVDRELCPACAQRRKRFGQLEAVDVKRLRQIETENARLKKLLAERDLEIEVMKEIASKKW